MPDREIYHRNGGTPTRCGFVPPHIESTPKGVLNTEEQRSKAARFVASAALSGIDAGILLDMLGLRAEEGVQHA